MALNVEQISKITKVLRLTSSTSDAEALSALRMTQKLLKEEGLELSTIVEAGLNKPEQPAPPDFNQIFAGFWNLKADAPAAPPAFEEPPKPRRKLEVRVSVRDLPLGFFNASVKIYEERRYQTGKVMLVLEVFDEGFDTIRRYPTMCAFGRQAAKIKDALGTTGNAAAAILRVEAPGQDGRLPKITSIEI